mgnify:FL=1
MVEPKILPGFIEVSPSEQAQFKKIKTTIAKNFELFGYSPIDTVVLEREDVLLAKAGGETEKQIFTIEKGEKNMCLRFDLTVSFARYVASRENELAFPFKRFQVGKVYRGERPQKGRYREFYQCDIDVIGKENLSVKYDAEVPCVMSKSLKEIGIENFKIKINNRKVLFGFIQSLNLDCDYNEVVRIIDKFDKIGKENFVACLKDLQINDENCEKILNFIEKSGNNCEKIEFLRNLNIASADFNKGVEELEEVLSVVKSFGEEENFEIDFKISRGLDYYTGTVYETFITGYENFGSICSGGRYDNLAGCYTNTKLPGVGMSIGLTRLFVLLRDNNLLKFESKSSIDVLILTMGDYFDQAVKLAEFLRENGVRCNNYFDDAKFKAKMNYANKIGVPYVAILGEDEIANDYITLKNMLTGEQQKVSNNELVKIIK